MYNLYYWEWSPMLCMTFSNYSDCKKACDFYKEKYPDAKIWMEPVVPVNSFEEFMDKTNGVIESYEK